MNTLIVLWVELIGIGWNGEYLPVTKCTAKLFSVMKELTLRTACNHTSAVRRSPGRFSDHAVIR